MEKGEGKGGEGGEEKEEKLGEKLRRRVLIGKKGGPCTPVPSWRLWDPQDTSTQNPFHHTFSARKLAAALWEFQHYLPLSEMNKGLSNGADTTLHGRHSHRSHKEKDLDLPKYLDDPCSSSPEQPAIARGMRKHVAGSLMKHHGSTDRNNHVLQPDSPASYASSLEITRYNPAVTREFKGRIGESQYGLKTSTELIKVLNRIWSLEEQHMSNISIIKALKSELDHARVKIKELLKEKQADRIDIDDLMKKFAEDKIVRKNEEQDRIMEAVQSARDKLKDEQSLRKRSESLHRKLARELSEVKFSLSNAQKDLERERKWRILLEGLCDEFARGIKDYEQKLHSLKEKTDENSTGRTDRNRYILHVAESWLDERLQIQEEEEEAQSGSVEKDSIVEKLHFELESFLHGKQRNAHNVEDSPIQRDRRNSLESLPLNETGSAPKIVEDKEDSIESDSHCFELNKTGPSNFIPHPNERGKHRVPSILQVKFVDQEKTNGNPEKGKDAEDNSTGKRTKDDEIRALRSSQMLDNHIKSQHSMEVRGNLNEASCSNSGWRNQASPVRQWGLKAPDPDASESPSKVFSGLKENTLKSKLGEARAKGSRSRFKFSKGPS